AGHRRRCLMSLRTALSARVADLAKRASRPVSVAILDSGIDGTHPDLERFVERAYAAEVVDAQARIVKKKTPGAHDLFGHGTAVASVITKIAPHVRITDYRILGNDNSGAGIALVKAFEHAL